MFEQEEDVTDLFRFAQGDELLLQAQAGGVVNSAELDDRDHNSVRRGSTRIKTKAISP